MKQILLLPFAVIATYMAPYIRQDVHNAQDDPELKKILFDQEVKILKLQELQELLKRGQKINLDDLRISNATPATPEDLEKARQEVLQLQQQYEQIIADLEIPVEETPAEEQIPIEVIEELQGKPHPLIMPDEMRLAHTLYKLGKYAEARNIFLAKQDLWAKFWSAKCLEKMGEVGRAMQEFSKIAQDNPETAAGRLSKKVNDYLQKRILLDEEFKIERILQNAAFIAAEEQNTSPK